MTAACLDATQFFGQRKYDRCRRCCVYDSSRYRTDSTKNEALGDTDDVDITLGTPYVRCAKGETTCDSHAPQAIAIFPVLQFHTTNSPGVTTLRPCRPDSGL